MEESLQDPPKKRQPVDVDETAPRPTPKKQAPQQDFALPSGPMPDVNPAEEEPGRSNFPTRNFNFRQIMIMQH